MRKSSWGARPPPAGMRVACLCLFGALGLACSVPAGASVYGSLANFDVVNTTDRPAYGFEIEIEDSRYDHRGMITSVFGLDRVFWMSPDPGHVVRYGKPTVEYLPGFGARITYGGVLGGSASTPSAPFVTSGESCWPGANPNWKSTSCDHFGVSTYGSPTRTNYNWLVDNGSGALVKMPAAVPAPIIAYTPPPPPAPGNPPPPPAPMQIALPAPDLGGGAQDNAFWVKVVKTELQDRVDLNDLLAGHHPGARPEIAGLETETEIEWQPLQLGMVDEVSKVVDAPSPSVVYKFQFFEYQGRFDDDGYVDPMSGGRPGQENQFPQLAADGTAFVTIGGVRRDLVFVGQQIAGFNAAEIAAVPEPAGAVLMLGGLVGIAGIARRRRAAAGAPH